MTKAKDEPRVCSRPDGPSVTFERQHKAARLLDDTSVTFSSMFHFLRPYITHRIGASFSAVSYMDRRHNEKRGQRSCGSAQRFCLAAACSCALIRKTLC